jgi:DNA-binding transcriptional MerR regulator
MTDSPDLTISQVAEKTALPASTIRYYDQQFGEFIGISRGKGRRRSFSPESVEFLLRVHSWLKNEGLSLRQVRMRLEGSAALPALNQEDESKSLGEEIARLRAEVKELRDIQKRSLHILSQIIK